MLAEAASLSVALTLASCAAPPAAPALSAAAASTTAIAPAARAETAPPSIGDLTWLSGCWEINAGPEGDYWEECWTDPKRDTMMGALRWIQGERLRMYELMVFEPEDDRLSFKLRHFSRGLVPWAREADGPMDFTVTEITDHSFAMHTEDENGAFRVTYTRRTGEDGIVRLDVAFSMTGPDGQEQSQQLLFTRRGQ